MTPTSSGARYYWDSCVLLAWINNEPGRATNVQDMLDRAEGGAIELVTSTISVVEVAFGVQEKLVGLDAATKQKISGLWAPSSPVKRVEFHMLIAEDSRTIIREALGKGWSIKPVDAIHVATAMRMGVDALHTYEDATKRANWEDSIGITVQEPPPTPTPSLGI